MSAYVYDLVTRGGTEPLPDSIQQSPDCLVLVIPFRRPNTILKPSEYWREQASTMVAVDGAQAADPFFLNGCIQADVSTSKGTHTGTFTGLFVDPDNEYMHRFSPGDWVFVWMFDNENQKAAVKQKINNVLGLSKKAGYAVPNFARNDSPNDFLDGFKFVGRVFSQRRHISVSPDGKLARRVSVHAFSFSEFDTAIYYDPAMVFNEDQYGFFFMKHLAENLNMALTSMPQAYTQTMLPFVINTFLGAGPGITKDLAGVQRAANDAFLVPPEVLKLLGRTPHAKPKYSDAITCYYGVQKYDGTGFAPLHKDTLDKAGNQYVTGTSLDGAYSPNIVPWANVPIWSVLQSFLNEVMNEQYTTLRVDPKGKVVPTYVARQIPFNTDALDDDKVTRFLSLPRWKVNDLQVVAYDTGKSNAIRVNYVQVRLSPLIPAVMDASMQRANNPPYMDVGDIERSGVYPLVTQTNSMIASPLVTGQNAMLRRWTKLVSDRMNGAHLKFNGTITTLGITEPIAVGDNLEYDGLVFHIENVRHSFSIGPTGSRTFITTMALTNGVSPNGLPFPELESAPSEEAATSRPRTTLDG